jgi:hypothetical protein
VGRLFDVSDSELDGMEARAEGPAEPKAYQRIPYSASDSVPIGPGGTVPMPPPGPLPGPAPYPLPPGPGDGSLATGAGKALIFVTTGLVVGAIAGGPWGAGAGVALVGAIRNLARTKATWSSDRAEDRAEAGKSATMAIFGLGLAGMLGYQAYKQKEA